MHKKRDYATPCTLCSLHEDAHHHAGHVCLESGFHPSFHYRTHHVCVCVRCVHGWGSRFCNLNIGSNLSMRGRGFLKLGMISHELTCSEGFPHKCGNCTTNLTEWNNSPYGRKRKSLHPQKVPIQAIVLRKQGHHYCPVKNTIYKERERQWRHDPNEAILGIPSFVRSLPQWKPIVVKWEHES